jgi:hypothetical protein
LAAALDSVLQSAASNVTGAMEVLGVSPAVFGAPGAGGVADCTVAVSFDNLNAAVLSAVALTEVAASLAARLGALPQPPGATTWPPAVTLSGGNVTLPVELSGVYDATVHANWLRALQAAWRQLWAFPQRRRGRQSHQATPRPGSPRACCWASPWPPPQRRPR